MRKTLAVIAMALALAGCANGRQRAWRRSDRRRYRGVDWRLGRAYRRCCGSGRFDRRRGWGDNSRRHEARMVLLLAESPPPLCSLLIRVKDRFRECRCVSDHVPRQGQCDSTSVTECYPPIRVSPRRRNMKVAALAALGVLIVLPANAGQQQRQYASPATTCDNDGHCTTLASAFPAIHKIRPKAPKAAAAVVPQLPQPRPAQIDAQSH